MTIAELLADAFGRVREVVHEAVDGLTPGQLALRPESEANSIGWLVWHLTRIQDDHIADVAGTTQVWTSPAGGSRGPPPAAPVRPPLPPPPPPLPPRPPPPPPRPN